MTQLSKGYAAALFSLAMECGKQQQYMQGLQDVLAEFKKQPLYVEFLSSPNISKKERLQAIEQAFGTFLPKDVLSFLQLLCESGRINLFDECVTEYETLYRAFKSVAVAKVTSVVPLSDAEKKRLQQKLEKTSGDKILLDCTTDETLLGGIRVEMDGKVFDGSVKHCLNDVREVMNR